MKKRFNNPQAETMRILFEYRRKLLTEDTTIESEVLKRLIGPDRAFHIYKINRSGKKK